MHYFWIDYKVMFRLIMGTLLLIPASVMARDYDSRWYFHAKSGYLLTDENQDGGDDQFYGVDVGKAYNERWSVELQLVENELDYGTDFFLLKQRSASANFLLVNSIPLWNPYFLVGAGAIEHDSGSGADTSMIVNLGMGGTWELIANRVYLRADMRYRYDFSNNEYFGNKLQGVGMLSVGFQIPLGSH